MKNKQQTIENECKKQIKAIENPGKKLAEYKELIKKNFDINRDSIPLEEEYIQERFSKFENLEKYNWS